MYNVIIIIIYLLINQLIAVTKIIFKPIFNYILTLIFVVILTTNSVIFGILIFLLEGSPRSIGEKKANSRGQLARLARQTSHSRAHCDGPGRLRGQPKHHPLTQRQVLSSAHRL